MAKKYQESHKINKSINLKLINVQKYKRKRESQKLQSISIFNIQTSKKGKNLINRNQFNVWQKNIKSLIK
jgi:hypothetical protein